MSLFRRVFDGTYRRARRAEGRGDYREAAELYAEADAHEEAGAAWLFFAARQQDPEERVSAYLDALRWIPEASPKHAEVQGHIGMVWLEEAQRRGVHTRSERERLEDAAGRLERAGKLAYAASAFELLSMLEDAARCLEAAGEIERLERLLGAMERKTSAERERRSAVRDYELAMLVGQRREAREALLRAVRAAEARARVGSSTLEEGSEGARQESEDAEVRDLLRRLEARRTAPDRCRLRVGGVSVEVCARSPFALGREGDIQVRGTGVSRRHCTLTCVQGAWQLEDLGSRNGTLIAGVPLGAPLGLGGVTEVGLGDDVRVRLEPAPDGSLALRVLAGLDADLLAVAGEGELTLPGVPASLRFVEGFPLLRAHEGVTLLLGAQPCVGAVELLVEDELSLDGVTLEVLA